jgi:putative DNA primase/helicase
LDEGRVKSLTGGDNIKARFIGEDYFEFAPSHTVWLAANDKPRITGTDTGIWRRMRLLPFTAAIPAESRDPTLDAQLAECRNAILRWAVEGAVAYCRDGLGTCAAVEAATTAYRTEEDVFGQALDDLTVPTAGEGVPKTELRALLTAWYESGGYTWQPNDRQIKQEMDRRGIAEGTITTSTSKTRCWRGIARKANLPAEWQPRAPGKSWHDRD